MPCSDGHVTFRMVLKVKRKSEPLAIAVKADCFAMSASLQVSMPEMDLREVNPNHPDTLDFGKVGDLASYRAQRSQNMVWIPRHFCATCRWRSRRTTCVISCSPTWPGSAWM